MAEKKIAEAQECIRQAEKCLKTSFFKYRPDYDGAASEYAKAATHYKNAKSLAQCKDCLIKASDCYRQNRSFFSAAKSIDQAAIITKDLGNLMEAAQLIERACQLFREHGAPDTAAMTLERGAKMIESKHPERAYELYKGAAEVVMLEDRPRQAAEFTGKAARILLKLGRYDEASEAIRREIDFHLAGENRGSAGRMVVALVLVELTRGDFVAARKAFQDGTSYAEEEEVNTLGYLLQAFDENDDDMIYAALNNPFIKHMDVEYSKLARRLQGTKKSAPKITNPSEELADEVENLEIGAESGSKQVDEEYDLC